MIYGMEGRDVATADITVAFIRAVYDKEDIHINMKGAIVTLLYDICLS